MKKWIFAALLGLSGMLNAQQNNWCGTDQKLSELRAQYPGFDAHMHKSMVKAASGDLQGVQQKATMYIPVVVHIIHDNGIGNISDEQVEDALNILNLDYNRQNADAASTRNTATAPFSPEAGMLDVKFRLAKIDPDGNCTNGIVRVNAPNLTYGANDDCKYTANGGSDQWPMDMYLNIWVVNSIESSGGAGITLGYAYLPYWPNGANYGILIRHDSFGSIETAQNSDGRTLTHEMGHLLGLSHIFDAGWGGSSGCHATDCGQNGDYCCDTPPQAEANWGCLSTWNSCSDVPLNDVYGFDAVDQIENFMSYNSCQNMFSQDQMAITAQNFIDINFMANIISAPNIAYTGVNDPATLCKADFDASKTVICTGDSIALHDRSFHNPTQWTWTITPGVQGVDWVFVGGSTSATQDPFIRFLTPGWYQISLVAGDGVSTVNEVKANFIRVLPQAQSIPFWEGFESYSDLAAAPFWMTYNPENNNGFELETGTGHSSNQCARLVNFGEGGPNTDELISSPVDLSSIPSNGTVTLSFRYAYRKKIVANDEWLKVFVSNNCGEDWIQRKTLHGDLLSSAISSSSWMPSFASDWVTVHMLNITSDYFVENFRFKFEFEGSGGNNFYLDDINIYPGSPSDNIVLGIPEGKELGEVSLYPNPAQDDLEVRFSVSLSGPVKIKVTDLSGQEVYTGSVMAVQGINLISYDASALAGGMYLITIEGMGSTTTLPFVKK